MSGDNQQPYLGNGNPLALEHTEFAADATKFDWLNDSEDGAWDSFVASHPLGTVCQTTRWRRALEAGFPHIQGRVLVMRDGTGAIRHGTTVYLARSRLLGNRLVVVPFGSRVDPLVTDASALQGMLRFLSAYRLEVGARSLQIRFSRLAPPDTLADFGVTRDLKRHYLPLHNGTEDLWEKFDSPVRRRIRKADREGVSVRRGGEQRDWDLFFAIHGRTRQRLRLPVLPRRFFAALAQYLDPDEWELLIAERKGEALGVYLLLIFNGIQQGEWSGDVSEGRQFSANHKLYWNAIQNAAARRCHTFCFGCTDGTNSGLLSFKRSWGCVEEDLPILTTGGEDHSDRRRGDSSITRGLAQQIIGRSPRPLYLGLSKFCYRHLG